MPLPSASTIARKDDTIQTMQYKFARMLEEVAGATVQVRTDDPRNHLIANAVNAARTFLTYLETLNLGNVVLNEVAGKYRFKADGTFQLWNDDQMGFQSISVHGDAGEEYIEIGELDEE
jgi:hypothetical protein